MSIPAALPALPGSTDDPGSGPVDPAVLDGLLDDAAPLTSHRDLLAGDHRDLVAALVVPAGAVQALLEALAPGDVGVRVVLVATGPDPLEELRAARSVLLDVDAVELVGARLPAPGDAGSLLDGLDSSVPSWITVPTGPAAAPLVDVLAADGAENVTLDVAAGSVAGSGPGTDAGSAAELARLLRTLVDRDLSFRVAGCPGVHGTDAPGLLNALCATRATLNGAEVPELTEILATRRPGPLVSALRRMSAADGAVTRAFLVAAEVPDATAAVAELDRLALLPG